MVLKLYNTLTRKKELFKPRKGKNVQMFVCGPTVYDYMHIGHARTYIAFDVIVRHLKRAGYNVFYLQNITDIDDRIISRAEEAGTTPAKLAAKFAKEYKNDIRALGIDTVDNYAPATKYILPIINQIQRLEKKSYAYLTSDGIYYDIAKFKDYGKLSGRTAVEAEDAVSRIDDSVTKRNKGDFALWKFSKEGEPSWPSPWGRGRPGWHIEDTAITEAEFGPQYDIHGGARDLIFPHHEAEIAQIEAVSGKKPLVKYWTHTGFLNINKKKMSKSLGNFLTVREALKNWSAETLRLYFLFAHYRSPIDLSEEGINSAGKGLDKLYTALEDLQANKERGVTRNEIKARSINFIKAFDKAMSDDFNTPRAVAVLFDLQKYVANHSLNRAEARLMHKTLLELGNSLGLLKEKRGKLIPAELKKLIAQREAARKKKNWELADKLRVELAKKGIIVEDAKGGVRWRRK